MASVLVRVALVSVMLLLGVCLAQKRLRMPPAALKMLMNDPVFENSQGSVMDDPKLVDLANSLQKITALGNYFTHRGRPRYGRSINVDESEDASR